MIYGGIFYVLKDIASVEKVLTLLIFNDPAIIGLFFAGLTILVEKNTQVITALFVTPVNHHIYILSRVLALSIVGLGCALGMAVSVMGINFDLLRFSFGVFGTCLIFSLSGVIVVCHAEEFLIFLLKMIPVLLVFSLPMLNYYEVTDIAWLRLFPIQGGLDLIVTSYPSSSISFPWFSVALQLLWMIALYFLAFHQFSKHIIKGK